MTRRAPIDEPPRTGLGETAPHAPGNGTAWYERLRERYRPMPLRLLLIGESPPDPRGGESRFFYSEELSRHDNLYRGVAEALYGERADVDQRDKARVLELIKEDGVWLIDAVDEPVNTLGNSARQQAVADAAPRLVERCRELAPELGVIICHGKVYAAVADALREADVRLLHDEPLPFPLGNWRARFVAGFRQALANQMGRASIGSGSGHPQETGAATWET